MSLPGHIKNAIDTYVPLMEGWTTPERCCEMAECILVSQAKVCVDIGVYAGRSTLAMGFAARELRNGMVFGLDPWSPEVASEGDDVEESADWWKNKSQLEKMHKSARDTIWDHHLCQWVTLICSRSEDVSYLFNEVEFLNVDGGHGEESSCRDIALYLPKLRPGNFLTFDDADWASTQKALSIIDQSCDLVNDTGKARTYRKR